MEVAAAGLRRLYLSDDPLHSPAWVLEDQLDRFDALGGPAAGRTPTMDELIQLFAQYRVQVLDEPGGETVALM